MRLPHIPNSAAHVLKREIQKDKPTERQFRVKYLDMWNPSDLKRLWYLSQYQDCDIDIDKMFPDQNQS